MSRYRPPQPRSSPHITEAGFHRLQQEEKALWQRRKHVTQALSEAAAEGDRSENAEYIYRKKELREIDRRIRYLQKRLPDLKIVRSVANHQQVFFGAYVDLLGEEDEPMSLRIVGADEIDPSLKYISIDSPMARQLLKQRVGDEILVRTARGEHYWEITGIRYDETDPGAE